MCAREEVAARELITCGSLLTHVFERSLLIFLRGVNLLVLLWGWFLGGQKCVRSLFQTFRLLQECRGMCRQRLICIPVRQRLC